MKQVYQNSLANECIKEVSAYAKTNRSERLFISTKTNKLYLKCLLFSSILFMVFNVVKSQTITSFSPISGCTGTVVTITGSGFTGTTGVSFGTTPAASYTVINSSTITAVLGAGSSSQIKVTTASGTAISNNTFLICATKTAFAYVSNYYAGTVSVINTQTNTVVTTIPVGGYPTGVTVSPDGTKAFVVITGTRLNNASNGYTTISVINTATNTLSNTYYFAGGLGPMGIAVSPDGNWLYVANQGNGNSTPGNPVTYPSSLGIIAVSGNGHQTLTVGNYPYSVCINHDGSKVYVTNSQDVTVSVVDTKTFTVIGSPITVGNNPEGICISPDGTRIYVANSGCIFKR